MNIEGQMMECVCIIMLASVLSCSGDVGSVVHEQDLGYEQDFDHDQSLYLALGSLFGVGVGGGEGPGDVQFIRDSCWLSAYMFDSYELVVIELGEALNYIPGDCHPYSYPKSNFKVKKLDYLHGNISEGIESVLVDSRFSTSVKEGDVLIASIKEHDGHYFMMQSVIVFTEEEYGAIPSRFRDVHESTLDLPDSINDIRLEVINSLLDDSCLKSTEASFRVLNYNLPECSTRSASD